MEQTSAVSEVVIAELKRCRRIQALMLEAWVMSAACGVWRLGTGSRLLGIERELRKLEALDGKGRE